MNAAACLLWGWLAAAAEPDGFDPSSAEASFSAGLEHYREGRHAEASADFARAYRREPDPRYLYSWAQAERKTGNCAVAVQLYRRYLEHDLPTENVDAARTNMLRCGYTWTQHDEKVDAVDLEAVDLGSRDEGPTTPDVPKRDWWLDPAGATLVAVGTASTATAIGLWAAWSFERNASLRAKTEELHVQHLRRADQLRIGGIVTSVLGAGLLVGGIVRYAIVRRRARTSRVALGSFGGSPLVTVRF
jgi:tetratricopeptide (TPR) repeat protein